MRIARALGVLAVVGVSLALSPARAPAAAATWVDAAWDVQVEGPEYGLLTADPYHNTDGSEVWLGSVFLLTHPGYVDLEPWESIGVNASFEAARDFRVTGDPGAPIEFQLAALGYPDWRPHAQVEFTWSARVLRGDEVVLERSVYGNTSIALEYGYFGGGYNESLALAPGDYRIELAMDTYSMTTYAETLWFNPEVRADFQFQISGIAASSVPEPSSLVAGAIGLAALGAGAARRRRRRPAAGRDPAACSCG